MENGLIELHETGVLDRRGREILKSEAGDIYKIGDGLPHTVTTEREPQNPIHDFRILSIKEQLGYDPGSYPDGFDPVIYGLEEKPKKWNNGLSL